MKKTIKMSILLLSILTLMTGCGAGNQEPKETKPAQELYPVTIDGSEILVGQTTVQTLLDSGLRVTVSEKTADGKIEEFEIDPTLELEANSYYSGGSIWITDKIFVHIAMVTEDVPIPMGEAVIARLEFSLNSGDTTGMEKIAFHGVPINEITREKAGEMFPDFTGDENMWLQYGRDYEYSLVYNAADGTLIKLSVQKKYDVDWNTSS